MTTYFLFLSTTKKGIPPSSLNPPPYPRSFYCLKEFLQSVRLKLAILKIEQCGFPIHMRANAYSDTNFRYAHFECLGNEVNIFAGYDENACPRERKT